MPKRLTARAVELAKPAKGNDGLLIRTEIPDAGKPGLYLVVQPSGRKSWAVRYRRLSDRVSRKVTLEGFPSLQTAHKLAQGILDRVADGYDPATERQTAKRQTREHNKDLVDGMFLDFLDRHVRRKNGKPIRESTRRETARLLGFKRHPDNPEAWVASGGGVLRHWKGRTVASIRKADVQDVLDAVAGRAPVSANRTLAALKTTFTWRVKRDSETLPRSPCDGVDDPTPEEERERALTDAELSALWQAAETESYPFGRMVQMLVLTGCRRDEVREAPWAEIRTSEREWVIPGQRTKNGMEHLVPITDTMAALLDGMPRIGGAGLLFTTTGETPISGLTRAKARLHDAMTDRLGAEPERWTLHDLRRTFVTGLQRLGFPLEVAEACVNHRSGTVAGVTGVYARHTYAAEKRAALEAWARHVGRIISGQPAKVLPMRWSA